ncbi:esterase FrsA [Salmonella enterica subsp. enterica serovar Choleraesuis]|nr:esterase FrsA [Salmonella enterica subsp. enterica serovar Choleraesuis]
MTQANLSETLFKPRFKHPETSTLVRRVGRNTSPGVYSALEGKTEARWYRLINRLQWIWRGVDAREIIEVLGRICCSNAERTNDALFDTVVGYRSGNWTYEWSKQAMVWQQLALQHGEGKACGDAWLMAANLYSIAAYPNLKGDELADQAQVLANRAYEAAAEQLTVSLKELSFAVPGGGSVTGFLHLPANIEGPAPTVLVCGGLDALQSDHYALFAKHLAPAGLAMLTIDMPSTGFSSKWKLTEDSSVLHQQVLRQLPGIPWIDHTRVSAFGFRFGANVAVRLAYLESGALKAVACLGPIVHSLLSEPALQTRVPDMYIDVLASRLCMPTATDSALSMELSRFSLKTQGLLGRRCPVPLLSAFWDNDPFSPEDDSRLIVNSSGQGKLIKIPTTPLYRSFDSALDQISDWIVKQVS